MPTNLNPETIQAIFDLASQGNSQVSVGNELGVSQGQVSSLLSANRYPPDKAEAAMATVIEQAEVVCKEWAEVA